MKKFMALYLAPAVAREQAMKDSTPEDMKGEMKLWQNWMEENRGSLVDGGAPLGKTKQANVDGVTDTTNNLDGYSIVQAESHEAAMELFGFAHPHFSIAGATVEVMEIVPMPTSD